MYNNRLQIGGWIIRLKVCWFTTFVKYLFPKCCGSIWEFLDFAIKNCLLGGVKELLQSLFFSLSLRMGEFMQSGSVCYHEHLVALWYSIKTIHSGNCLKRKEERWKNYNLDNLNISRTKAWASPTVIFGIPGEHECIYIAESFEIVYNRLTFKAKHFLPQKLLG